MGAAILVITNGDSAAGAIRSTQLKLGHVLPWRDVLHEGPVPGDAGDAELRNIRAHYLAACGYDSLDSIVRQFEERDRLIESCDRFDEIVLWFEHDLYDQLQLIQVLTRLEGLAPDRVSIVCDDTFVAQQSTTRLESQFRVRQPVGSETYAEAGNAWSGFTSSDPTQVAQIAAGPASRFLPYLASALSRLVAEFPDIDTGLSITEECILRSLNEHDILSGQELFREHTASEHAEFLGDWSFFRILLNLAAAPNSLLRPDAGSAPVPAHPSIGDCADLAFRIQPLGRRVLMAEVNAISLRGIDRWIGGAHLVTDAVWIRRSAEVDGERPVYSILGPLNLNDRVGRSSNLR